MHLPPQHTAPISTLLLVSHQSCCERAVMPCPRLHIPALMAPQRCSEVQARTHKYTCIALWQFVPLSDGYPSAHLLVCRDGLRWQGGVFCSEACSKARQNRKREEECLEWDRCSNRKNYPWIGIGVCGHLGGTAV